MDWTPILQTGLQWSFVLCFGYLLALYAFTLFLIIVAAGENIVRTREGHTEDYEVLRTSRFTIPVSIITPAYNEEVTVLPVLQSLLDLNYPESEVILVNDGSTDGTLDLLKRRFELQPREVFYRRILPCREVRTVYRSTVEPRLTVVHKENGGKADALNCGVNLAKYRYVCCVDGDTVYNRDALLKAMRLVVKDPANVVCVTSLLGVSSHPEVVERSENGENGVDSSLLSNFDNLDYLRSFITSRLAWSRLHFMLSASGAFMIWRRDVVNELGGFSKDFSCEDLEITFRTHEKFLREKRPYRVLSLPDAVARTEGPAAIAGIISQRARWQRVILETVWHYRHLFANPRYSRVGLMGFPYYVFFEALAPFFQIFSVITLLVAALLGLMSWTAYLCLLGIMAFGMAIGSTAAILLQDSNFRHYQLRDLVRLILLAPLDLMLFRPVLFYAQSKGAWGFLRGRKDWHRFERNSRHNHSREAPLPSAATAS